MVTSPSLQSLVRKAPVTASFATLFLVLLALRPVEALHGAFILPIVLASRSGVRAGLAGAALAIGLESALLLTSRGAILSDHAAYVFATWGLFVGSGILSGILFSYLEREAAERETMAEIGRIVTSSVDIGDVYQRFAERFRDVLDFDRLTIETIDVDEGTFANTYAIGLNVPECRTGVPIDLSGSMTETVVRRRAAVLVQGESAQDSAHQYPSLASGLGAGIRSFLSVPLIYKDEVMGVLHLRSAMVNAYSDRDSRLAERVAHQIAGAVANAQLHADLEREAKEREVLAELGRIISSSLDVEEINERFGDSVRKLIQFDRVKITLLDAEAGVVTDISVSGLSVPGRMTGDSYPLVGTLSEEAFNSASAVIFQPEDRAEVERLYPGTLPGYDSGLRSFLDAPLIVRERPVGSVNFRSAVPFLYTERDRNLSERVALQIAGAVANARLHADLEREAKEREVLAEIGRVIDASTDVHEVYQQFADQVRLVLPWDRITVNLLDEEADEFRMAYVAGLHVPEAEAGSVKTLKGSPTAGVAANRSGLVLDLEHHVKSGGAPPAVAILKAGILTALRVPLIVGGAAIGTLCLGSKQSNAYDERDLGLAERIGAQIAGAIANSQLNQALSESNFRLEEALGELKRTQEELIRQERLGALGQMASGIAHDFNNSLTPILGFSELLLGRREGVDDQDLEKRYLLNISLAAEGAAAVVRRLREFYRRERPEFSPVLLDDVVAQSLSLTQAKWKDEAQAKGVTIRLETELEGVPPLNGSESELREALTNLVFNAVDAMPEGGNITIRSRLDGSNAVLEVSDTGGGMSEEVKRSCLDPFFTTKGPQGTGMGLPMVYGIVRRHRGTLDIESEVGRGTTFVITLPIDADVPQRDNPLDAASPDAESLRILLVDDEPMVLELLSDYLVAAGHSVETASNGREGAEKFREGTFDLVVTDRAMPEMGGAEMASVISKQAQGQPIIMLTGFGDVLDDRPDGVTRLLSKPIKPAELRRAVQQAVARGHAAQTSIAPRPTQRPVRREDQLRQRDAFPR